MKITLYSHGFGVYKDDRGLFPDIAAGMPEAKAIMFDYNRVEANDTLVASTLGAQADKLRQVYDKTKANNPDAVIDLVCHSQGCVVAAMAQLEGVRRTIFLAPPDVSFGSNIDKKIADMKERKKRPGTKILPDGSISYPRRDGSTTIIPQAYWDSRKDMNPVPLYTKLAERTELIMVQATNDEVIGMTDFSGLPAKVKIVQMDTGHDFEGNDRQKIVQLVSERLQP